MVLIGLFAALLLLVPAPAHSEPISLALLASVGLPAISGSLLAGIVTFALTTLASLAISYVASALLKPAGKSGGAGAAQQSTPINTMFNVRQAAGPRVVVYGKRRVAGTYALMHLVQANQGLNTVILLAGHECEAVDQIIIGDDVFDFATDFDSDGFLISGWMAGFIRVRVHLGSANQAADQDLIDDIALYGGTSDDWGPDHRLRGICWLYVRFQFGPSPFPGDPNGTAPLFSDGIPNVSAVLRGKKDVYDPRSATTGYSNNPALCLANYLCDTTYGVGVTYATGINETALIAAANSCDEDVTLQDGSTENRYECNGAFECSEQPQTIIGYLLASMHGLAPYDGEQYSIQAGVYQTPTITLTENDLRGGMTVGAITSRRDLFNAVKGTFTNPDQNWQECDFPPVVSTAFATADGATVYKDIVLPFTTSASMAQRIAKIELLKARKQITVMAPCKLTAWRVQAGDTVMLTYDRWGFSSKVFQVRSAKFVMEEGEGGPTLGVDLELAETASSVFSWDATEEQVIAEQPATTLPNIRDVVPPTNLEITETLYSTMEGGGVKSRADLTWAASPDGFAREYEVGYKLHADSTYKVLPRVNAYAYTIPDLPPGLYDFYVSAINYFGNASDPVTTTQELTGVGDPPAGVSGLSVMTAGGLAILRWDMPDDITIRVNGGIEFRHENVTSGATWATATPIGERVSGSNNIAIMPLKAGTYLAKFFIRLANDVLQYSSVPATVYTAQVALGSFTTLDTQTEDPTFGGSHTQTEVSSSKLRIIAGKSVGEYAWTTYLNNTAVKRCRITVATTAAVTSRSDLIDNWADVDSRPSWDTTVSGHEATALTYVSTTNDDPTGSPTWSDWRLIDSAEFSCWGARFRTDLWSLDETWNIEVSALSAVSEEIV